MFSDLQLRSVEKNEMSFHSPPNLLVVLQAEVFFWILYVSLRTPGISHHRFCILPLLQAEGKSLLLISIWRLQTHAVEKGKEEGRQGKKWTAVFQRAADVSQSYLPTTWAHWVAQALCWRAAQQPHVVRGQGLSVMEGPGVNSHSTPH